MGTREDWRGDGDPDQLINGGHGKQRSKLSSQRKQYDEYMNSQRWRTKRQQYLTDPRTDSRCAGCGYSGVGIEIHHKTYLHLGNEPLDDLIAVCYRCHMMIHQDFNSWSERLAEHTDNVLSMIRRKIASGEMKPTSACDRRGGGTGTPNSRNGDPLPKRSETYVPSPEVQRFRDLAEQINEGRRAILLEDLRKGTLKRDRVKRQKTDREKRDRQRQWEHRRARARGENSVLGVDPNQAIFDRERELRQADPSPPISSKARALRDRRRRAITADIEAKRNEYYRNLRKPS